MPTDAASNYEEGSDVDDSDTEGKGALAEEAEECEDVGADEESDDDADKKKVGKRGKAGSYKRIDQTKTSPSALVGAINFLDCYCYYTNNYITLGALVKLVGMEEVLSWKSSKCTLNIPYEDMKLSSLPPSMTQVIRPLQSDIQKLQVLKKECKYDDVLLVKRIIEKEYSLGCVLAHLSFRGFMSTDVLNDYCH